MPTSVPGGIAETESLRPVSDWFVARINLTVLEPGRPMTDHETPEPRVAYEEFLLGG